MVEVFELSMPNGNCLRPMKHPNVTDRLPWKNSSHRKLQEAHRETETKQDWFCTLALTSFGS